MSSNVQMHKKKIQKQYTGEIPTNGKKIHFYLLVYLKPSLPDLNTSTNRQSLTEKSCTFTL